MKDTRNCFWLFSAKSVLTIYLAIVFLSGLVGCACVLEPFKKIAGTSTKEIERGRDQAVAKIFDYDYATLYTKTKEAIARIGAYVYSRNEKKSLIAVYVSDKDTTPVGIFITKIDDLHAGLEITSPSTFAKEYIASKLFAEITMPGSTQIKEKLK